MLQSRGQSSFWLKPEPQRCTVHRTVQYSTRTAPTLALALSGMKKNILKFSPKFHQFLMDVHGIKSVGIFEKSFFVSKIGWAFYLVLDFFDSAQAYYI